MTKDRNQENPIDGNIYPTIELTKGKELAPHIRLPDNYRELVPIFYEKGGREYIENYIETLQEVLIEGKLRTKIRLEWETDRQGKLTDGGLTHILTNGKSSLNLEEDTEHHPEYRGKNLNPQTCLVSEAVAMQYIAELLRSNNIKTHTKL